MAHAECILGRYYKLKAHHAYCTTPSDSNEEASHLKEALTHYEKAIVYSNPTDNRLPLYKSQVQEINLKLDLQKNPADAKQKAVAILEVFRFEHNIYRPINYPFLYIYILFITVRHGSG